MTAERRMFWELVEVLGKPALMLAFGAVAMFFILRLDLSMHEAEIIAFYEVLPQIYFWGKILVAFTVALTLIHLFRWFIWFIVPFLLLALLVFGVAIVHGILIAVVVAIAGASMLLLEAFA